LSRRFLALVRSIAAIALLAGCAGRDAGDWADVRDVTPSILAAQGATHAALAADRRGRVALTWVSRDAQGQDVWLALSSDSGVTFASPIRVNPRRGSVSSSAEGRPIAAYGAEGELLIAWSERRGDPLESTDLVVRASGDGGHTFGPPVIVNDDHADGRAGVHGSPSLVALTGGGWFAVWTDPREHAAIGDSAVVASLFFALSSDGGQSWSENRPLTTWACPGCRVTALTDSTGMVAVAYRSSFDDVRDPALAVSYDRGASFALDTLVSDDGWEIPECPAEGPALTMDHTGGGHYAWITGAAGGGGWIAPWRSDGGIVGLRRALSDSVVSARHPQIVRMGAATLLAVEARTRTDPTRGTIAVRTLESDGAMMPWLFLGADAADAWLAPAGDRSALVCWTERGAEGDRVRVVRLTRAAR
jgi:hypothetical protein